MFVVFATQEPPKIHKTKPAAIQHGEQGMTGSPVYWYQNSNFARPSHLLGRGRAGYETTLDLYSVTVSVVDTRTVLTLRAV